ncbi:hypothetical protein D7X88_16355 [bacterium C-53]|nr:hypothetical protein [Lachnospiraceae bacterium]NBI04529.1 hypothetical protein [Lachnospiraceae bacterium]RKJ08105.1 hypothetical protein D7X88_16355 [bacterium C-53]
MKVIKNSIEMLGILKENKRLIIYGGGTYGAELRCELNLHGFYDYYVCDSNNEIGKYIHNFVSFEKLNELVKCSDICIIVAIKNSDAVKEIVEKIAALSDGQFDVERNIFQYVPESRDELIARRKREGLFNGSYYKTVMNDKDAIQKLKDRIVGSEAFLFARWGTIEGDIVYKIKAGVEPTSAEYFSLKQNAGVFPITKDVIDLYCETMGDAACEVDMLCVFYWQKHLNWWVQWFSRDTILVSSGLEYPFFSDPWTKALEGLKVLVIHPFSELIYKQYEKREKLFVNHDVLPEFELITYKAVQSLGGNNDYKSWIEALKCMQNDIADINFDIALIGCGAYGMPLGAFIKKELHKKAIHMGGSLQILFGIKGRRWESESYDYQHKLYNEYWVRPTEDLKPKGYENVEDGCYW